MKYPKITIDLKKIESNTQIAAELCAANDISLVGVTKACLGSPEVARAMIRGGASRIGDSRIPNITRLREAGVDCEIIMLRLPAISEAPEVVALSDTSLNSDVDVIRALGREAVRQEKSHKVIVMVNTGDQREGITAEAVPDFVEAVKDITGIIWAGIGTNVACLSGCRPNTENLSVLMKAADSGARPLTVSGGNSSAWNLLIDGSLPSGINELRFGEALLLGKETAEGKAIPDFCQDAFVIEAEIIEAPASRPGHFIAALGSQDVDAESLVPLDTTSEVVRASSDHLVISDTTHRLLIGNTVRFIPGYAALLRAMTSPYIAKEYV